MSSRTRETSDSEQEEEDLLPEYDFSGGQRGKYAAEHARGQSASTAEGRRLAELSLAVRESSLKRLRSVPHGRENWRPSATSLSISEIARHLLAADVWLFEKLRNPSLEGMVATVGEGGELTRAEFQSVIDELQASGERRAALCESQDEADLAAVVPDDRFGGDVTVWWVIARGNLDHEAHHRGQLATYLRLLSDRS